MKKREVHRVFGVRENAVYTDREDACLIPVRGSLVGVIRTPKGYFLLGGGLEKTAEPSEKDHEFLWIAYGRIRGKNVCGNAELGTGAGAQIRFRSMKPNQKPTRAFVQVG